MKKFITSFLALLTCCSLFAACNSGNKDDDSMPENSSVSSESSSESAPDSGSEETNPHLTALNAAKDNLLEQLINQNVSVRADYQVLNSIYSFHAEETFAVTWSVNVTEGVTIKEGDNCYIVDVDETLDEDLPYVLTATITDSDGCSVNLSFDRVVEKAPQLVPVAITEKPAENTPYKLYVYQSSQQADCYFMGEMSGFYYKTSEVYTDGVDLYVEYLSDSDAFNVYFNDADGNKQYIGVQEGWNSKNSHWTFNVVYDTTAPSSFVYSTEYKTIITTVPCRSEANYSDQSAVQDSQETLYLGNYSTHMTISASKLSYAATSNVGGLVTMVDKSELGDSIKVADIKESLTVVTKHTLDKTVELPVSDERYPDAAIAWAVEEGKGATVTAEGLKLVIPETATTAKLTATITLGETTATKEFTLELGPKTVAPEDKTNAEAILAAAFNLAEGEVLPGEGYTLTGKITKVNNAWDAEYSNITVTISVNDKAIECYRLKSGAADASILKVGDTITATGILKNYNGKIEFDAGCTLDSYTPGEVTPPAGGEDPDTPVVPPVEDEYASMTIPQALEAADTTKVKVSGTVCEINTVWNDQFNNITVTITDADGNKLYVYRLATKVELGDIVTIKGEMATYNGRQIGAGATAEITGKDNSYVYVEMTIPEALAAADGTNVIVTGTVSEIGTAYSEQYGNISVNIVDEANNVLYLYRLSGNVEVGNVIKVRGTMATYNGNRQLTGGTYELISEGEVTPPAGGEGGEVTPPAGGEEPDTPVVNTNKADFETFDTKETTTNIGANSKYQTYNTVNGWVAENSALQAGGATDMNPNFTVLGADNSSKGVCLNGKTSAAGKLTSPTIAGGIAVLKFKHTNMFTDTAFAFTVTITAADGTTVSKSFTRDNADKTKYVVTEETWVLETAISGEFTIVFVNDCPSNLDSNKDRVTIWDINWSATVEGGEVTPPAGGEDPDTPVEPVEPTTLTIKEALELGATKEHNTYTTEMYYVTGEIIEVQNTQYGNMVVSDGTDSILIYGLYLQNEDGTKGSRYDAMETKPIVGDTVKVLGVVGKFSNNAQLKDAYLITLTAATDAEKLVVEKNALVLPEVCNGEGSFVLPSNGTFRNEVAITWELTAGLEIASIVDGKLVITNPETELTVTVVAHLSYSETTDSKTFNITAKPSAGASWKMVTDVNQLKAGAKILIVAKDSNYAIGDTQNSNNRAQAAVSKADGSLTFDDSVVEVLTLCAGTKDGTFAFKVEEGGYLYAASSSSNYLKTQDKLNDNASWTISIAADGTATVVAQGTNSRNTMQYNQSFSLFACYGSASQKAICIYIYA